VSHAGSRLLADLADRTTLTGELGAALSGLRGRARHDPGRVLVDLAVAIADGAEAISDISVLADQPGLFGPVASDSTCWRLLDALGGGQRNAVAAARARAREVAWAQRAEATGSAFARSRVAGGPGIEALVIDLDAHIVVCHSEKQQTAPTFKHTFGYHPLLAFLDNTGEFLAATLRPGNAGSNTAADHITVLDDALAQLPDAYRHGHPILIRADCAGCTKAFLAHVRSLRAPGVSCEFSVGWSVGEREHAAIGALPARAWSPAVDVEGAPRALDEAAVAEITGLLPPAVLADYPEGTRVIVRRERPHPGAQLDLIEQRDGYRYTAHATDTAAGQHAWLDARHRAHARVEDRIRTSRDTGLGRLPSRNFTINAAWLAATMIAVDLLAFAQTLLLHDTSLARAEPKALRYRLLHVAARLTRGQRRLRLRIDRHWPWATQLATAFTRLTALPVPAG
jgi:hypothetical protein